MGKRNANLDVFRCLAMLTIVMCHVYQHDKAIVSGTTIAMALALLVLFEHFIVLPRWLCRLCVWMAPSMFGVYLLHGPTSFGKLFLAIVIAAVACFLICLVLDLVRRYSLHGIMAICKRK